MLLFCLVVSDNAIIKDEVSSPSSVFLISEYKNSGVFCNVKSI